MVKKKTQSKRVPLSKKHKIAKKVTEAHRKSRKEAKKNPQYRSKLKKDPGIPSLWPFKEKLLHQIEEQQQKREEEKTRQKAARANIHNKNRNLSIKPESLSDLAEDAAKRSRQFERDNSDGSEDDNEVEDAAATGRKDNSKKAYYREFRKVLENSDVLLEVLDARDPMGTRTKHVERMIMDSGINKRLILILNKIDLVPRENVEAWLKYLRNEYPTILFKSSTQTQRHNLSQSSVSTSMASEDILQSSECLGADQLIKLLKNYSRSRDLKVGITVGVVGYPNVGKSSVINSLKRAKVCGVAATPGFTKLAQTIHLDKNIKLLDCPGIVFAKQGKGQDNAEVLLRNAVKVELLEDPITPVEAIIAKCNKQSLMVNYSVPFFNDAQEFLVYLARQRGKLKRGGIPDLNLAARSILQDWNTGKIPFYTLPPDSKASHHEATVVQTWAKEFSLDELDDSKTLSGVKGKEMFGNDAIVIQSNKDDGMDDVDIDMEEDKKVDEDKDDEEEEDDEDIPDAVPISSESIVALKPKKKAVVPTHQLSLFTPLEQELNPKTNRDLKKQLKVQQKKAKKLSKAVVVENDEVMEDDGEYDFGEYFKTLSLPGGEEDEDEDL